MSIIDEFRTWVDGSVGTRGAVRNCHLELERRREIDRAVRRLQRRIPARLPEAAPDRQTA